jgi:hypothetical protein
VGALYVWYMKGVTLAGGAALSPVVSDTSWTIVPR